MAYDDEKPEDHSDIPTISLPPEGFTSRIPSYLLQGKTDYETYILNEISKMGHFVEWAAPIMVDVNQQVRRTNGRVTSLERSRNLFKTKWGMLGGAIGVICTLIAVGEGLVTIWAYFHGGK